MFLMKKNHLDFKDLAQSLAMDKGKLERYVTVSFLLVPFNSPVWFVTALLILCLHEVLTKIKAYLLFWYNSE